MNLDFQYNGVRYMINFDDPILKGSLFAFELRVYHSLASDATYSSSLKRIENGKVIWGGWDYRYLPKEAQEHCDRYIKNMAFL